MKISDLRGNAIVSMSDGERVGTVRDVLIDTGKLQATALVIGGRPGQGYLPLDGVKSFGPDAITIENADGIQWATGQLHDDSGREAGELMKLHVMDGSGTSTGTVHELTVDLPSGNVLTLSVRKGGVFGIGADNVDVPVSDIVSIGPSLVTVKTVIASPDEAHDRASGTPAA
jgi:sporulation protein YlmC with PRC-barrel domain